MTAFAGDGVLTWSTALQKIRARGRKRMFFACTHVTLRATEVPLWLDAGIEVVPEEVDTANLLRQESLNYDNIVLHPILRRCARFSTLPTADYDAVRRVRMRQRKGILQEIERNFFNHNFDIIYIATDLETAVNIRKWFRGDVIFRYFGIFDNLKNIDDQVSLYNIDDLKNIICIPIFNSLYELNILNFFPKSSVIHGYVNRRDLDSRWRRPGKNQHAAVVMHNIHEGSTQANTLRRMLPLSKDIEINILGKNNISTVPCDILRNYNVIGAVDRDIFSNIFSDMRLLIHPFDHRYHNHYTNIEAIVAGIPVLFRTDNPLYLEQSAELKMRYSAENLGAYETEAALFDAARALFDDHQRLIDLAKRQRVLLEPYRRKSVKREVRATIGLFRRGKRAQTDEEIQGGFGPHAQIGCADNLRLQEKLGRSDDTVPLYAFAQEDDWQLLERRDDAKTVIRLPAAIGMRQFIIGQHDGFEPGLWRLSLRGHSPLGTLLKAAIEIYQDKVLTVARTICVVDDAGDILLTANINAIDRWTLSIYLQSMGIGEVDLGDIGLTRLGDATKPNAVTTPHASLYNDKPTPLYNLVDSQHLSLLARSDDGVWGLALSQCVRDVQWVLGQDVAIAAGVYLLEIDGCIDEGAVVQGTFELFCNGAVASVLTAFGAFSPGQPVMAVTITSNRPWALLINLKLVGRGAASMRTLQLAKIDRVARRRTVVGGQSVAGLFQQGIDMPFLALFPNHPLLRAANDESGMIGLAIPPDINAQTNLPPVNIGSVTANITLQFRLLVENAGTVFLAVELWCGDEIISNCSKQCAVDPGEKTVDLEMTVARRSKKIVPVLFSSTSAGCVALLMDARLVRR